MSNRKFVADFKTEDGKWRHNEYILGGPPAEDLTDEQIVLYLESRMSNEQKMGAACVLFVEFYDPDDKLTIQDLEDMAAAKKPIPPGVVRYVIADDDLYQEWLKPEVG